MRPEPSSHQQLDSDTRIVATDDDRMGRMYTVQCKFGWDTWQDHGSPHESYADALAQGQRVARRERSERPDRYVEGDVDDRPESQTWQPVDQREAVYFGGDRLEIGELSARIRRGRKRVGWR